MNVHPGRPLMWSAFLVAALLLLAAGAGAWYGVVVALAALALALGVPGALPPPVGRRRPDRHDLLAVAVLYAGVVALFLLAFQVFTTDRVAGLFLAFGGGMLLGVVGPVVYTVWYRRRPLADLGLTRHNAREALALGVVLAGVQVALTLWGYDLPAPVDWVPLLVLALTVGLFEAVFFRGFVQTRLEASYGPVVGVGGAALLYAAYHVGYGMDPGEMVFLLGLGVVYGIAYALVRNVLVLWPLLIPLGSFYNNLESGGFELPWASLLGFADVLGLMAAAGWLAHRHEQRLAAREVGAAAGPGGTPVAR